jgi:hypothetical protein
MWACLSLLNRALITEWLQDLTHRLALTVSPLPFAWLEVLRSLSATPIGGPPAAHHGLRDGAETEGLLPTFGVASVNHAQAIYETPNAQGR